jgi:hypothetical protein
MLKEQGAEWKGTTTELAEFVGKSVPYLPPYLQEPAHRYYVRGLSRFADENGLHRKDDALLYQHIRAMRAALVFFIKLIDGDPSVALSFVKGN